MGGAGRRAKLLERLNALEQEFEGTLLREPHTCANGVWGLFGQNLPHVQSRAPETLEAIGEDILSLRRQLGEPTEFALLTRYRAYCTMRGPNTPGEPRLAKQFLDELGKTAP